MKLLEHEAKALLSAHSVPVPIGQLVTSPDDAPTLPFPLIIKVQIPTGGRGKAGGIQRVNSHTELARVVTLLLSKPILGHRAKTLLAEEAFEIEQELYLAITIDRPNRSLVLLAHRAGGVDIESTTKQSHMLRILLDGEPDEKVYRRLFEYFNLPERFRRSLHEVCYSLWKTCVEEDALLVEVNPLIVTRDNKLIAADAKIELDDAAAFRHPDRHIAQKPENTQFVVLNEHGTVGSMANGAGLAMATVDAIQSSGAEPANFLDVGGGTNTTGMVTAFHNISELPSVKAIVVNIFGGITRCNEVADAIVQARQSVKHLPPLFIRLTGTNEAEGRKILEDANIPTLPDLKSCVEAAAREVL